MVLTHDVSSHEGVVTAATTVALLCAARPHLPSKRRCIGLTAYRQSTILGARDAALCLKGRWPMTSGTSQPARAVFISYRRADSAESAGRIYDRLVERFGDAQVFKDVDSIQPGVAFADYIVTSIGQSAVELVIIGPRWLTISAGWNRRRLDDPGDYVRLEIETALRAGVPVIPVLVMGATLPPAQRLPDALKRLVERNSIQVRPDPDFRRDMDRVIAAVEYWMTQPRTATVVVTPAEPETVPTMQPSVSQAPQPLATSAAPDVPVGAPPALETAPLSSPTSAPTGLAVSTSSVAASAAPDTSPLPSTRSSTVSGPSDSAAAAKLPSSPIPAKRRRIQPVIFVVALTLVVALLAGTLYSLHALGGTSSTHLSPVDATYTAMATSALATLAAATQVSAQTTQTAIAQIVRFPYHAAAPGFGCDKGNAPWTLGQNTAGYDGKLTCSSDGSYTQFSGKSPGTLWTAPSYSPFPQNYTLSVRVSHISVNSAAFVNIETAGPSYDQLSLEYYYNGKSYSVKCIGSAKCAGDIYYAPTKASKHSALRYLEAT